MATNQPQTTVLELPHTLTSDEKLANRNRLDNVMDEMDALEDEKSASAARFKSREKELAATFKKLRSESKVGVEMRKYRCNIFRNRETQEVEYVVIDGPRAGDVVKRTPFEAEDWAAISEATQVDIDFPENPDAPDEDVIRAQADLTTPDEVQPDMENGQVIGGPNTDAYNQLHADSPYQHLSENVDFNPAIIGGEGEQAQGNAAEPTDAVDVDKSDVDPADYRHFDATDSPDDSEGDDEPSDDDDPQPDPAPAPTPKRKANRRKDADKE